MAFQFVKMVVELNDETVAGQVKNWLQGRVDLKSKPSVIGDGEVTVRKPDKVLGEKNFVVETVMRLSDPVDKDDLLAKLKSKVKEAGIKNSIERVTVKGHLCSHTEGGTSDGPCTDNVLYEWVKP